jgi:hypothetical protein
MTAAEQMAINFTRKGIEGIISHNERQLAEIDELDAELGDVCREARQRGREMHQARLAEAQEALAIKLSA